MHHSKRNVVCMVYTSSCTISNLFELKKLVDFQINPTSCFHILVSKFKNNRPSYIMMSHILYRTS